MVQHRQDPGYVAFHFDGRTFKVAMNDFLLPGKEQGISFLFDRSRELHCKNREQ